MPWVGNQWSPKGWEQNFKDCLPRGAGSPSAPHSQWAQRAIGLHYIFIQSLQYCVRCSFLFLSVLSLISFLFPSLALPTTQMLTKDNRSAKTKTHVHFSFWCLVGKALSERQPWLCQDLCQGRGGAFLEPVNRHFKLAAAGTAGYFMWCQLMGVALNAGSRGESKQASCPDRLWHTHTISESNLTEAI